MDNRNQPHLEPKISKWLKKKEISFNTTRFMRIELSDRFEQSLFVVESFNFMYKSWDSD